MIGKRITLGAMAFLMLSALAMKDAGSADVKQRFSARGLGTNTCARYLQDRNDADAAAKSDRYVDWFTGFLTAYNWLQPDTYAIAPDYKANGLLRYLDLYCGKNPKSKITDAATGFVKAVYSKRQKVGS